MIPAFFGRFRSLMQAGDFAGAVSPLERAVQLDPKDKEALNRLGEAYAGTHQVEDARRAWERALVIDPQFEAARQSLGRLQQTTR